MGQAVQFACGLQSCDASGHQSPEVAHTAAGALTDKLTTFASCDSVHSPPPPIPKIHEQISKNRLSCLSSTTGSKSIHHTACTQSLKCGVPEPQGGHPYIDESGPVNYFSECDAQGLARCNSDLAKQCASQTRQENSLSQARLNATSADVAFGGTKLVSESRDLGNEMQNSSGGVIKEGDILNTWRSIQEPIAESVSSRCQNGTPDSATRVPDDAKQIQQSSLAHAQSPSAAGPFPTNALSAADIIQQSNTNVQTTDVPQQRIPPSPPDSEIPSEQTCSEETTYSDRHDTLPSYHFVSPPPSQSEHEHYSVTNPLCSLISDDWESCALGEQHSLSDPVQQEQAQPSSYSNLWDTSGGHQTARRRAFSTSNRPLLNLVWRDIGNEISRAYHRQDPPPLLSPRLSKDPLSLTEGFSYFIYSDDDNDSGEGEDIIATQGRSQIDSNPESTAGHQRVLCSNNGVIPDGQNISSGSKEPADIFSSDSEMSTDDTPTNVASANIPTYRFIPWPKSIEINRDSNLDCDDYESISHSHTCVDLCHDHNNNHNDDHDRDEHHPSNVQPGHLAPHCVYDLSFQPETVETYTPNTSSGFSDTDDDDIPSARSLKRKKRRRPRYRLRRRNVSREADMDMWETDS